MCSPNPAMLTKVVLEFGIKDTFVGTLTLADVDMSKPALELHETVARDLPRRGAVDLWTQIANCGASLKKSKGSASMRSLSFKLLSPST
mmetsp:Transcript_119481/g.338137  ORF Transcript_119481/g.338137 Transcript_119481/m.338137 type:complete len:89 (+) Transcript_119481:1143-1409(+)